VSEIVSWTELMASTFRILYVLAIIAFLHGPIAKSQVPSTDGVTGFCMDGVWSGTHWPGQKPPANVTIWGSFCKNGDNDVGRVESEPFPAPAVLSLYLAGYPGQPGLHLTLKNAPSGKTMELRPASPPGATWQLNSFALPAEWVGQPVQLIAEDRATGARGWLAFTGPVPGFKLFPPFIPTNGPPGGFCPNGVYLYTKWPFGVRHRELTTWGSYCKSGDADTGWATSKTVNAGPYLSFYVAGYPTMPGIRLAAENVHTGEQLLLTPPLSPALMWRPLYIPMPAEWVGQPVRLVVEDRATGVGGWVGFSEPFSSRRAEDVLIAIDILGLVLCLAVVLLLPPVAVCLVAAVRGVTDPLDLTSVALLALGLTGYGAFWMYFLNHTAGVFYSYGTLGASCAAVVYVRFKSRPSRLLPVRPLIVPAALVVLATIFIVSLGLLRGGEYAVLDLAPTRFSPPDLVGDHILPKILADGVFSGHIPRPIMADWLSSDRPPLQAGNIVWTYPWTSRIRDLSYRDLSYLGMSVFLQCSFLAGLWAFLTAGKIGCRPLTLAIAVSFFSGFTFVHGFYTWPKLYPVAYLLIVAAYLLTERYHQVRDRRVTGALVGVAVALAMLCHGGSFFAILGLACSLLFLRRCPSPRFLLSMTAAAVLTYAPWVLYQKFYEPPGDRLVKFHLTGVQEPHPEVSLANLLISSYKKAGLHDVIEYKISNFEYLTGDLRQFINDVGVIAANLGSARVRARNVAASRLRGAKFISFVPCLGLFSLGPLALLLAALSIRKKRVEFILAGRLWLCTMLTIVLWCLFMFGPIGTGVHVGSFFMVIAALTGSCLALWALRPVVAVGIAVVEILWNAILYIWVTSPAPVSGSGSVTATLNGPLNIGFAAACLLSAAAMFAVLSYPVFRNSRKTVEDADLR
jgi:hypothetical protein